MTASTATLNLTSQQHAALSARDRSISLAAGAGCGKTFVLTERYLSYLDPRAVEAKADLHELVAITFTDAAAREMRERIRLRCYRRVQEATDLGEKQTWNRLMRAIDTARISTIHSFCATLLRNHAAEAAVDPRFEMLDQTAADLLRSQTVDDRLRQLLLAGDESLIRLAVRFRLDTLRDEVVRLLGNNARPMVDRWSQASPEQLAENWRGYLGKVVIPTATETFLASEPVQLIKATCRTAEVLKGSLREHFQQILAVLARFTKRGEDLCALCEELHRLARVQGVCTKKDWDNLEQYNQFKNSADAIRKLLSKSVLQRPLEDGPLLEAAETGLELLRLVADVADRHEQVKQARNALEFDDLLLRAHQLLTDSRYKDIRRQLNQSTRLLMVDEFQDTDPRQVEIVQAFCGDDWAKQGLFVVGDFKQSIYRFRGAQPLVSSDLRSELPEENRLSLTTNFRSQPALLDFVNALFHDAFSELYEPLRPSRPQGVSPHLVEFLWAIDDGTEAEDELMRRMGKAERARVREARFIARRVAQLLDSGEPLVCESDKLEGRPLQLGDVAILLRSLSDVAIYEEALREQGLDYYLAGGHAFYAQQEIYDVLHLLRSIASCIDDLSIAGVLRSPIFALKDETLFWLAQKYGSLNAGLFANSLPKQLSAKERAKTTRAAAIIGSLRARKDQLLVAELLHEAIEQTGYDALLLCEFLGHRKLANLEKLLEQARAIDRINPGDLNGFITQLSEFVVRTPKEPLAATQAEGDDVIRIMSIHHAKGLEFPLVVVPDLNRAGRPAPPQAVFDKELGPLVRASDPDAYVGWNMHQSIEQQQEEDERKRLLYVACTRAADYLILSSGIEDLEKPKSDWMKFLNSHFDLQSGACLTELPQGFHEPRILVTTEEPAAERRGKGKSRGADLEKLIEKTRNLADAGQGIVPESVKPIPVDTWARKQFSFSRLSGQLTREQPPIAMPADLETESISLDPLALGTLIHTVLERVDFKGENDIDGLCRRLAQQHLSEHWEAAAAEAAGMIEQFMTSFRAGELSQAKNFQREVEFVLPWPGQQNQCAGCYLHGFIDCLYQDDGGGWHVLDYKSNRVVPDGVPEIAEKYALQMYVYSQACERALKVEPVESVLHFLRPSVEFAFKWDEELRTAMAAQLDTAMQQELVSSLSSIPRKTQQ